MGVLPVVVGIIAGTFALWLLNTARALPRSPLAARLAAAAAPLASSAHLQRHTGGCHATGRSAWATRVLEYLSRYGIR